MSTTPDAAEPKALLVDYGGVLTASVIDAFSAACASIGVDARGFLQEAFGASQSSGRRSPRSGVPI